MKSAHVMTQDEVKALVLRLIALGDDFEAKDDPRWYDVARAAAALDGMRLGVVAIALLYQPRSEVSNV